MGCTRAGCTPSSTCRCSSVPSCCQPSATFGLGGAPTSRLGTHRPLRRPARQERGPVCGRCWGSWRACTSVRCRVRRTRSRVSCCHCCCRWYASQLVHRSPGLRSRCRRLCSGGPLRPEGLWAGGHAERRTTQGQGRCGRWCLLVGASAGGLGGVQPRSLRVLRPVASGRGGPSTGRPRRGLAWNGRARGRGCLPRHAGCGGYGGVLSYVHAAAGPHRPGRSARRATGAQASGPKLSVR